MVTNCWLGAKILIADIFGYGSASFGWIGLSQYFFQDRRVGWVGSAHVTWLIQTYRIRSGTVRMDNSGTFLSRLSV